MTGERLNLDVPPGIEAVSFDVFDTLLVRSTAKPPDIFLRLEVEYVARYGRAFEDFARQREFAEWRARDLSRDRCGTPEIKIDDIYAVLNRQYDVSPAREIELELASCFPRKAVVDFYHACRKRGLKVFILSDMYLPQPVIESMLRRCGVDHWDLFLLSCEIKESKDQGGLYRVLKQRAAESFGLAPDRIMHVGDNPNGDVRQAQQAGLFARPVPPVAETCRPFWDNAADQLPELPGADRAWLSLCRGLSRIHAASESPTPAERAGFEAAALAALLASSDDASASESAEQADAICRGAARFAVMLQTACKAAALPPSVFCGRAMLERLQIRPEAASIESTCSELQRSVFHRAAKRVLRIVHGASPPGLRGCVRRALPAKIAVRLAGALRHA